MPNYLRFSNPQSTVYFTIVSYRRRKNFIHKEFRQALRVATSYVRNVTPFNIDAWVLLPDHMHCIFTFPENSNCDFSDMWGQIKRMVTKQCAAVFRSADIEASRRRRHESAIWQRRFWEHHIRSEKEYRHYMNYVYWNPVKHGLVENVKDWPYSTFHRDVKRELYPPDWGANGYHGDSPIATGE